jgi:hypothetical protein
MRASERAEPPRCAGLIKHFGRRLTADGLLEACGRLALLGQLRRERSNDRGKKKGQTNFTANLQGVHPLWPPP